jgi:hypothetical protein
VIVFVVEVKGEVVDEGEDGSEISDDLRGGYR